MEVIVITGASSGIGRELALQLAAPNLSIWLIGRDANRLHQVAELVREKGAEAHAVSLDLQDVDAARHFLSENFPRSEKVSAVYLAAAVTQFGEVKDTLLADWHLIYQINLVSVLQWFHHFYQGMIEHRSGKIVIVSSLSAYVGYPTATAYATMKAGLLGFFRSIQYEAKAYHVNVHLASPGYVETGIYRAATYRNTDYDQTISSIRNLGLPMISPTKAAEYILRRVKAGNREFAYPSYAAVMKFFAPRFPWAISIVHRKMIQFFRHCPK